MSIHPNPSTWPLPLNEAVNRTLEMLSEADKNEIQNTPENEIIDFHFGLAMNLRLQFGLWKGNEKLLRSCGKSVKYRGRMHPDDASIVIVEALWKRLRLPDS